MLITLPLWGFCVDVRTATLTGAFAPVPQGSVVNLTADGPADWVHWGLYTQSSLDRKFGVLPQIPDFTPIGFTGPYEYADNFNGYSWSDGTPTPAVTNTTTGVWVYGKSKGFQLNFPADTTIRTLKVYVGTFGAQGEFEATLGGTRLKYSDTSISNVGNGPGGVYTLTYCADSPGQTLTVKFVVERTFDPAGNVTLQAATLNIPGANYPPTVRITSPADDDNFSAGSNIPIILDAADADGAIANVEFFQGATRLGESTASPHTLIWSNVAAGNYILTAKATDEGGAVGISTPVEIFVNGRGGLLSRTAALPPASVDLTADGSADWAHWGLAFAASFDHKAGVSGQIANFTRIGAGRVQQYSDNYTAYNWSDGTPTAVASSTRTGVFINGLNDGFAITAPADTALRTLRVYVGLYGAQGHFQAYLSDFSAPAYSDTSLRNIFGNAYSVYTLTYAAAAAGQTLTVKYTAKALFDADFGNVTIQAASLSSGVVPNNSAPSVTILSPTNHETYIAPANITITADALDSDGAISQVEFFNGATRLGQVSSPPYTFTWSNVAAGSYALTATAMDDLGSTTTSGIVDISVAPDTSASIAIFNPLISGSNFTFSFATQLGQAYVVQAADSSIDPGWNAVTNVTGTGLTFTVADPITTAQRFYRVINP